MWRHITTLLLAIVTFSGCIFPYEDLNPENAWRGYCFKNNSSNQIIILHIAANIFLAPRDSIVYTLNRFEEKSYLERTSDDIFNLMQYQMNRQFETVKVFRADTVAKIWHGPLSDQQTAIHTPYEIGDWERIEKNDTIILRFTITDKDFE